MSLTFICKLKIDAFLHEVIHIGSLVLLPVWIIHLQSAVNISTELKRCQV
jgi:hypothetical protein